MAGERVTLINGSLVDYDDARVHVEDRGLQFSESVYEVIAAYNGRFFRLDAHIERLRKSAAGINLTLPPESEIRRAIADAAAAAKLGDGAVYVQVTAGVQPRQHAPPAESPPNLVVIAQAADVPDFAAVPPPATCMTTPDRRWSLCYVKSTSLVLSTMAKKQALAAGFDDAIFVRDGRVTESSSSNLFLVADGALVTPPADSFILHGITRMAVMDAARRAGVACREEVVPAERLLRADEVFLTSTTSGVRPVTKVDSTVIGDGAVGPVTRRVLQALHAIVAEECGLVAPRQQVAGA